MYQESKVIQVIDKGKIILRDDQRSLPLLARILRIRSRPFGLILDITRKFLSLSYHFGLRMPSSRVASVACSSRMYKFVKFSGFSWFMRYMSDRRRVRAMFYWNAPLFALASS